MNGATTFQLNSMNSDITSTWPTPMKAEQLVSFFSEYFFACPVLLSSFILTLFDSIVHVVPPFLIPFSDADQSGMMGYSYGQDDGPIMCFNAAKSWQLGWYDDKSAEYDTNGTTGFNGKLYGFVDFNNAAATTVILKLNTPDNNDYYVNFNRKTGFNSGSVEGGNQVLITTAQTEGKSGTPNGGYAESSLVAKLSAGGSYSFTDSAGK